MPTNSLDITFPGNLAQVDSATKLRAVPTALIADGTLYIVPDLEGVYAYDASAVAADNNNDIIKPNDKTAGQAGRWVKSAAGLAPGATGPADNTYTSLAALLASDPTRKSARLVPDSGETAPAGNFNYIDGEWVRQAASGIAYDARTLAEKVAETPSIADTRYAGGAKGTGGINNAPALVEALRPANAGYKTVPAGIYTTAQVNQTLSPGAPNHIDGDGPGLSVFRKITGDSDAVLALSGAANNLDNHSVFSNFSIDNGFRPASSGTGLRLTDTARGAMYNLVIDGPAIGFHARGALLYTAVNVLFRASTAGYKAEVAPSGITCNMNGFIGGGALGCGTGYDVNNSSGFGLIRANVELCGVAGDFTTGGVVLRPNIAAETGFATVGFFQTHFERNTGNGGLVGVGSSLAGAVVHVVGCDFVSNANARDIILDGTYDLTLIANSGNGIVYSKSRLTSIIGGFHNQIIEESQDFFHNTQTADGKRVAWSSQRRLVHDPAAPNANDMLTAPASRITGGSATTTLHYKYGSGSIAWEFSSGRKLELSTVGVGFNGATPVARGAAIANPTDAASTQSALISLLTYLRSRGDIAP